MTDPDCQPFDFPCWQHYADHERSQPPTKWVINLAHAVVRFRAATARTDEDYWKLYQSAHSLHELINQRWRNCVRAPYEFAVGSLKEDTYMPEDDKIKASNFLEQLGFKLQLPRPSIKRRF